MVVGVDQARYDDVAGAADFLVGLAGGLQFLVSADGFDYSIPLKHRAVGNDPAAGGVRSRLADYVPAPNQRGCHSCLH